MKNAANAWSAIDAQMRALGAEQDQSDRIALLEHQLGELDRYALTQQDFDALNETHKRLANAGALMQGSSALAESLDGDSEFAALRSVSRAQNELASARRSRSATESGAANLLEAAAIQLGEASSLIARYRDELDLDPGSSRRSRIANRETARTLAQTSRSDSESEGIRRIAAR